MFVWIISGWPDLILSFCFRIQTCASHTPTPLFLYIIKPINHSSFIFFISFNFNQIKSSLSLSSIYGRSKQKHHHHHPSKTKPFTKTCSIFLTNQPLHPMERRHPSPISLIIISTTSTAGYKTVSRSHRRAGESHRHVQKLAASRCSFLPWTCSFGAT